MTLAPFIPYGDRVVIKPEVEEKTKGGIYIPAESKEGEETAIGRVMFVGEGDPGGRGIPIGKMRSKVGMRVQYYTMRAVKIGDVAGEADLVIVGEQDVIGARPTDEELAKQ
jgi:co-chaperonin GroES (HSP10)